MVRSWGMPLLALGVFLLPLPAGLTAAGLSEESRLAKLESRCCDGDDRACVKLLRTRLELTESRGKAYLPSPRLDDCLYGGFTRRDGVVELLAAAAKTTKNPVVREYAITHLRDQKLLVDIAKTAADREVCLMAMTRIRESAGANAESLLAEIAKTAADREVRHQAAAALWEPRVLADPAIQSVLAEVARTAAGQIDRQSAALKLSDPGLVAEPEIQALLAEAVYDRRVRAETRVETVGKIRDAAVLVQIARGDRAVADSVRAAAVSRLTSQAVLIEITRSSDALGGIVRAAAAARLNDQAVLIERATADPASEVRVAAVERLLAIRSSLCRASPADLERLSPGDAVGIEDHLFSIAGWRGDRSEADVMADLRDRFRTRLRSVLTGLGYREPSGGAPAKAVIECVTTLSSRAVRYYPERTPGPGVDLYTAAKARGVVSVHTGERCCAPIGVDYEVEPASYVEDLSGHRPYFRYQWALDGWTRNLVGEVIGMIRPAQQQLAALVRSCAPWDRELAERVIADHLDDQALLAALARTHENHVIRGAAVRKLDDQAVLAQVARTDANWGVRYEAAARLIDQDLLALIATTDPDRNVRSKATQKLTDQQVLAKIARTDEDGSVRAAAAERLTDQALLAVIAQTDWEEEVRKAAIKKLTDRDLLRSIAAGDAAMRGFAEVRLWKLEHGEP